MSRILKAIKHPKRTGRFILVSFVQKMHFILSDNFCIRLLYLIHFDRRLNLDNPTSFNEKLNWLKMNDHNSSYSKLVDKYEVKLHVASLIGKKYIVNCYGVWNHFDDIDFTLLPDKFVIKTTHDSGGVYICRDKKSFDFKDVRKSINKRLKRNFYYISWEFPYKDVCPRIIVEQLLEMGGGIGQKLKITNFGVLMVFLRIAILQIKEMKSSRISMIWNSILLILIMASQDINQSIQSLFLLS